MERPLEQQLKFVSGHAKRFAVSLCASMSFDQRTSKYVKLSKRQECKNVSFKRKWRFSGERQHLAIRTRIFMQIAVLTNF